MFLSRRSAKIADFHQKCIHLAQCVEENVTAAISALRSSAVLTGASLALVPRKTILKGFFGDVVERGDVLPVSFHPLVPPTIKVIVVNRVEMRFKWFLPSKGFWETRPYPARSGMGIESSLRQLAALKPWRKGKPQSARPPGIQNSFDTTRNPTL